jgi:hypothetical protein
MDTPGDVQRGKVWHDGDRRDVAATAGDRVKDMDHLPGDA